MKLWDIVRKVGSSIVREVVPGGGLIVDAVNAFLPEGDRLPKNASGNDIDAAVRKLPPEQQAALLDKEFDIELTQIKESNATVRAMLESDAANQHSTRPYIAKGAFHVVAFVTLVVVSLWAYGVAIQDDTLVTAIMDGWHFVLAVVGPLVTLLWAYFGILKQEHKNKLDAAGGNSTASGLGGIVSALIKRG